MMKKIIKKPITWILIAVLFLMTLNYFAILEAPINVFFNWVNPIQRTSSQAALQTSGFLSSLLNIKSLVDENNKLRQENYQLYSEVTLLEELKKENEFLKKQLNIGQIEKVTLVLANVIGQEPNNIGKWVLIDKGSSDGIELGAAVMISANILVGKISGVTEHQAHVMLITENNSAINCLAQETRVKGIARGNDSSQLNLELVLQADVIETNQNIITSGDSQLFPPGLLIGQIGDITSSDPQIFQMANIQPAADFQKLEKVFVIAAK